MWNRSSSLQGKVRLFSGAAVLGAALVLPFMISVDESGEVSAAQAVAEQSSIIQEGMSSDESRIRRVELGGLEVDKLEGTIVYQRLPNGTGEIIGRLKRDASGYYLQLPPKLASQATEGGAILYSNPVFNLDDSIPLVLAPDGLEGEFQRAYDELWPVFDEQLIQPIKTRLRTEVKALLEDIAVEEEEKATEIATELYEELSGEIEDLGGRLTTRAWEEIGVWGVTVGVARKTWNYAEKGWGKLKGVFGGDDDVDSRAFLSDERKEKLKAAIIDELKDYWDERGDTVKDITVDVLGNHEAEFTKKVEEVWLPRLFERAVMPEWNHQQDKLLLRVSWYLEDMANRRLVTQEGSLMLPLAYAFRSAAEITDRPLLVFQPGVYEVQGDPDALPLLPVERYLHPLGQGAAAQ